MEMSATEILIKHNQWYNTRPAIRRIMYLSHLVIEHLHLPVVLLQLCHVAQQLTTKVQVDQTSRAELGHPWFFWTQAVETFCKCPEQKKGHVSAG